MLNFVKIKNSVQAKQLLFISIIALVFFVVKVVPNKSSEISVVKEYQESAEIREIKASGNPTLQVKLYRDLIERVGPEEAQEELYRSGLPFTGQTHLLNHTIGDYLYEKYGTSGLRFCKDYFLSSCHHGFILHVIADGGMPEVLESFKECQKSGFTVSSQCAHGIGHGFLAYVGYKNLTEALKTCDEVAETIPEFPLFNCYDGVFMENIWAVHEGEPSKDRWVKENDPIYPCNDKRIDSKYLLGCWSNQPSLAYQQMNGDIKKVGKEVCEKVKDEVHKATCFNGLARQIHPLTAGSATKTFELCGLMPTEKWANYCVVTNAVSGYSVGDRATPFQICSMTSGEAKADCYGQLFGTMRSYKKPEENTKNLCAKISDREWWTKCESQFVAGNNF